jgi:hypothetical protein
VNTDSISELAKLCHDKKKNKIPANKSTNKKLNKSEKLSIIHW